MGRLASRRLVSSFMFFLASILALSLTYDSRVSAIQVGSDWYSYGGLNILLLGDSFSAGNGAHGGYYDVDGCYRARNNWSEQFVRWMRNQGHQVSMQNRACSGAETEDVTNDRDWTKKRGSLLLPRSIDTIDESVARKEIERRGLCVGSYDSGEIITESITINSIKARDASPETAVDYECSRKLRAQTSWVGPEYDVVMLTIGGNDLGFSEIIGTCVLPTTAGQYGNLVKWACPIKLEDAFKHLEKMKSKVYNVLEKIRQSGLRDDAKIILVGYPFMSLDNGHLLGDLAISTHVRQIGRALNEWQSDAVREFNQKYPGQAYFVGDVQDHFALHEPNLNVWLANPKRWIHNAFEPGLDFHEWYHPNSTGHFEYSNVLKKLVMDGAIKPIYASGPLVDMVFNIDTTSTMVTELAHMKSTIRLAAERIRAQTRNARFAVTSFRNNPEITNNDKDYSAFVNLDFTYDIDELVASIDSLVAEGTGGTGEKTVWSGVMAGLNLKWRPGVEKVIVTTTSSRPFAKEPSTDYTKNVVSNKAFRVDPAQMFFLVSGNDESLVEEYREVSVKSGSLVSYTNDFDQYFALFMSAVASNVRSKPHAWLAGPIVAKIGEEVVFDASGSYSGSSAVGLYEWDFEADGEFELVTTEPIVTRTFNKPIDALATVRVTDFDRHTNLANTHLLVSDDGDSVPREIDNCPDAANEDQLDNDSDGIGDVCDEDAWVTWILQDEDVQRIMKEHGLENEAGKTIDGATTGPSEKIERQAVAPKITDNSPTLLVQTAGDVTSLPFSLDLSNPIKPRSEPTTTSTKSVEPKTNFLPFVLGGLVAISAVLLIWKFVGRK